MIIFLCSFAVYEACHTFPYFRGTQTSVLKNWRTVFVLCNLLARLHEESTLFVSRSHHLNNYLCQVLVSFWLNIYINVFFFFIRRLKSGEVYRPPGRQLLEPMYCYSNKMSISFSTFCGFSNFHTCLFLFDMT